MHGRSDARIALVALAAAGLALGVAVPSMAVPRAVARSLFEPGSCVLLGPTEGNRHVRVFIDAGHGGPDPGGVGTTSAGKMIGEAPLNVLVATDAATLMRRNGFSVVLSRTGPDAVARPLPGDLVGGVFARQEATATWWHATYAPTVRTPTPSSGWTSTLPRRRPRRVA